MVQMIQSLKKWYSELQNNSIHLPFILSSLQPRSIHLSTTWAPVTLHTNSKARKKISDTTNIEISNRTSLLLGLPAASVVSPFNLFNSCASRKIPLGPRGGPETSPYRGAIRATAKITWGNLLLQSTHSGEVGLNRNMHKYLPGQLFGRSHKCMQLKKCAFFSLPFFSGIWTKDWQNKSPKERKSYFSTYKRKHKIIPERGFKRTLT